MKKRKFKIRYLLLGLLCVCIIVALVFMHFEGFNTGDSLNQDEFKVYAQSIDKISVPKEANIIALGEATHGNVEFQKLKLDVFKKMVEENGVKAFAIEGDFGGCEKVNEFIHGADITAKDAIKAIGFKIYQTKEMEELITYMRQYNENAKDGEDLRFYGFDMQRVKHSMDLLIETCKSLNLEISNLQKLVNDNAWSSDYKLEDRIVVLNQVKSELENIENTTKAIHIVDLLIQNSKLQDVENTDGGTLRDKYMAENVEWILAQEKLLGYENIFISGHNSHVAKWGSFDSMGKLLSKNLSNNYYVIGTDFYKTKCNLPSGNKRINKVFYSHDPLAKTAKLAGFDECWLDFSLISQDSELYEIASDYTYMGTLGESYSIMMRLLPPSYRMFQPPMELYDSMIFVSEATPTKIVE